MIRKVYTVVLSDKSVIDVYASEGKLIIGFDKEGNTAGEISMNKEEIREFQKSIRLATRDIFKKGKEE